MKILLLNQLLINKKKLRMNLRLIMLGCRNIWREYIKLIKLSKKKLKLRKKYLVQETIGLLVLRCQMHLSSLLRKIQWTMIRLMRMYLQTQMEEDQQDLIKMVHQEVYLLLKRPITLLRLQMPFQLVMI